jgi:hypothetical protein
MMKKIALYLSIIAFTLNNNSLIHSISTTPLINYLLMTGVKGTIRKTAALAIDRMYPSTTKRLGPLIIWDSTIEVSLIGKTGALIGLVVIGKGFSFLRSFDNKGLLKAALGRSVI